MYDVTEGEEYNHLYSVAALTTVGANGPEVVERYTYTAYGKQTITDAGGNVTRAKSAVGFDRSFTGYTADSETGLLHARARQYSPTMGRFVGRDPLVYPNGYNMYFAYLVPHGTDPTGMEFVDKPEPDYVVWFEAYGQSNAKFTINNHCEKCECNTYKLVLDEFRVEVTEFTIRTHNKVPVANGSGDIVTVARAGVDVYRTYKHERQHIEQFKKWHDENYPDAKDKHDGLGCYYKSFEACDTVAGALRGYYEGSFRDKKKDEHDHLGPHWDEFNRNPPGLNR